MALATVRLNNIVGGKHNVRRSIGDILELTASIKERGVLQPIVVRPKGNRYEVIIGARRVAAAKKAGLKTIPAIIREMSDTEALSESLIENVQRGDLELEEEGAAYEILENQLGSIDKLRKFTGINSTHINETMDALSAARKLKAAGIKVTVRQPVGSTERMAGKALPKFHAVELERTFKTELVEELPKSVREKKYVELARAIAPLAKEDAQKILDRFKVHPEKPVQDVREEALAKITGVALRTYLRPRLARKLSQIAEAKGVTMEDIIPQVVEKFIDAEKALTRLSKEIDVRESLIYTIGDYDCQHCKKHYVIKCDGRHDWVE